jgi:predicted helicase
MTNLPLFTQWLAEEANAANRIKQDAPVMVVLGNPPYSGHSANTGKWIANLLRGRDTQTGAQVSNYFEVDDLPLGEKNPKWLNDDYVKFIRFAQWRIEQTGHGVLAFITNNGYLDNPTFRGMRQSLMQTFDDIYIVDLHGNSKKKERAPDGSKDENVFDIQQGVAIGIFIKRGNAEKALATVHHAHLWGAREVYEKDAQGSKELAGGKYHWLWNHDLKTTEWKKLEPQAPFYLFVPQDMKLNAEYQQGWKVTKLMPVNSVGIVTSRDNFVFDFEENSLRKRMTDFLSLEYSDNEVRSIHLTSKDKLSVASARKLLRGSVWQEDIIPCLYRPFDIRPLLYNKAILERSRLNVMSHMLAGNNVGLITSRLTKGEIFKHTQVTRNIIEVICMSPKTSNNGFLFPLYLYPTESKKTLFDVDEPSDAPGGRRPNLAPEFVTDFAARLKMAFVADGKGDRVKTFGPEDVFNYIYALLHSPTYRSRYSEFLKGDFPRLPLTSDPELFRALCDLGAQLVALHLMETSAPAITEFPATGNDTVEVVRYTEQSDDGEPARVWINDKQYFEGVPPEVWHFQVGGYQVANKWLKDRKGRKLTYDEKEHYRQVVAALAATINLMAEIDTAISEHGGWPLT